MGLLSREGMRDGNIGICWDAGHIGICGICGEDGGYVGYVGRTTSPKSARPGCRFWSRPPNHEERETGTANDLRAEKGMLILYLTC